LDEEMDVLLVRADLQELDLIAAANLSADFLQLGIDLRAKDRPPILRRADDVIEQYRNIVALVDELAHVSKSNAASCGECTRRDSKGF